jgi:hypothetical protein
MGGAEGGLVGAGGGWFVSVEVGGSVESGPPSFSPTSSSLPSLPSSMRMSAQFQNSSGYDPSEQSTIVSDHH